jgi:hypothetical protein
VDRTERGAARAVAAARLVSVASGKMVVSLVKIFFLFYFLFIVFFILPAALFIFQWDMYMASARRVL